MDHIKTQDRIAHDLGMRGEAVLRLTGGTQKPPSKPTAPSNPASRTGNNNAGDVALGKARRAVNAIAKAVPPQPCVPYRQSSPAPAITTKRAGARCRRNEAGIVICDSW